MISNQRPNGLQAYILGTLDDSYSDIISRVFGIIFLATPHRGSRYARTLNSILSASIITKAKIYVAELEAMSPTLQDINEQFRLVCKSLHLISFYESLKTQIGTSKVLVVGRDSGVLGYPSEISSPMNADHHNVCKFKSRDDPNYVTLRDVIRDCVMKCSNSLSEDERAVIETPKIDQSAEADKFEVLQTLTAILGVEEVLSLTKYQELEGTCQWIQTRDFYDTWLQPSPDAMLRVIWLTGLPGIGKSTLTQALVNNLKVDDDSEEIQPGCQYHFFTFSDMTKQTVAYALRCIAFQLALEHDGFCRQLCEVYKKTKETFEEQEAEVVWTRIFVGIIFKMDFGKPLYWIFDGLDESDNALSLVNFIFKAKPKSPIRIFLTSRPTSILINFAQSRREFLTHVPLTAEDTRDDVKLFIRTTLDDTVPISEGMRDSIAEQMFTNASGSFVWVKLALKTLERAWHTEEDIQRALSNMPQGMQALFDRMARTIVAMKQSSPRNFALASRILAWATCSAEPLTIGQLAHALEPEFTKFQNLEATIVDLCGHFITTVGNTVVPIHETAKSFLLGNHQAKKEIPQTWTPLLNGPACHEHLAAACLAYLSSEKWVHVLMRMQDDEGKATQATRNIISENRTTLLLSEHPFLPYAVSHWAYHIRHTTPCAESSLLSLLQDFFDRHVLSWIHACAILRDLRIVTRAARYINFFAQKCNSHSSLNPTATVSRDQYSFFSLWTVDLIRIVGRFGRHLAEKPTCVYKMLPPMCPRSSMVFKTYASGNPGARGGNKLSFHGIMSDRWDDCLARLPIGEERTIYRVLSTVTYLICLVAVGGEIIVCYSETCEEARRMTHGEYVAHMAVNKSGSMLATAGIETLRVWEISSGEQMYQFDRSEDSLVMSIVFGTTDEELIVGYDDFRVTSYGLQKTVVLSEVVVEEDDGEDYQSCPRAMVFSPDVTKLAIAISGRPMLIWDMEIAALGKQRPIKCVRASDMTKHPDGAWNQVDSIIWHPDGLSVFVLYQDTTIVRFFLDDDDEAVESTETLAREMIISHGGKFLLTSDNAGTLSLWLLPGFHLVYRLSSPEEELVRDLAFSPDSQRFYDIRGAICNIWEPEVLLCTNDDDDSEDIPASDKNERSFSDPVLTTNTSFRSQITTVARGPGDRYCVCGKDDGSIAIFDASNGSKLRKAYSHANGSSVIALAWSPDGKYIASADDNGRILVKRLESKDEDGKWAVFPCLNFRDEEPVQQIIFHPSEKLMLIAFPESDRVWNLKAKTELWRRDRVGKDLWLQQQLWINHPLRKNLLMCMRPDKTFTVLSWFPDKGKAPSAEPVESTSSHALTEASSEYASSNSLRPAAVMLASPYVRRFSQSDSGRFVVAEVLSGVSAQYTKLGNSKGLRLDAMHSEAIQLATGAAGPSIKLVSTLDEEVCDLVRLFLGCYKEHIVFLNHEYWVCTFPFEQAVGRGGGGDGTQAAGIKRQFFLPRDCISPSSLPLVTLAAEVGSVLFPRNGELAVVRNGLRL
ncbi:hypothetical protein B0H63DRAFT_317889 [Podospora didyma]|uniref:NACHT domain-containing protein n=1 Tax=Podospora didyma TaxID=330526 RepID=A0AAE0K6T6_9PEZI|nr:hypothetical protein B0H63DRAFT_317889 [Podospora didyma]